jgi:hypothetical protein
MSNILAIDPGNIESGYVIIDFDTYKPIEHGKIENEILLANMQQAREDKWHTDYHVDKTVIEMVASYGMAVGQTVFDTCVWIGRFYENTYFHRDLMYRKDVKLNMCGQTKANDSNIRQALIDRFSYPRHAAKGGKGVKAHILTK